MRADPICLCSTEGLDNETWLEYRRHGPNGDIPFALGGSDIGTIYGVNPFCTPLALWRDKKGIERLDDSGNLRQKKMGHLMEPVIAEVFREESGYQVIEDYGLYQHPNAKYNFLLANLDYEVITTTGRYGVLDCKNTSYRMRHEWEDGKCPNRHEYQVRVYMAIKGYDVGFLCALWGNDYEVGKDMAIVTIYRDADIENQILETAYGFIQSLHRNEPPKTTGTYFPERTIRYLAELYYQNKEAGEPLELDHVDGRMLQQLFELQNEKKQLTQSLKANQQQRESLTVAMMELFEHRQRARAYVPGQGVFYADFNHLKTDPTYKIRLETPESEIRPA